MKPYDLVYVYKHLNSHTASNIHDVGVTDLIRNCELTEDGAALVPKYFEAAITF
jgi:hypothetical protein